MDPAVALPTPPTTPVKTPSPTTTTTPTTSTGGMGAYATRALAHNDVILEETPLLAVAERSHLFAAFARLSRKRQTKALKLHASDHFKPGTPWLEAIWDTNSFATGVSRETGLFPIAARFNHACEPRDNIHWAYDTARRRLRLWVGVEEGIAEGEELKICYGRTKTPELLYRWYGFRCACGACEGLSDQEVDRFSVKW
ncbi:SET domain protein [Akanthomyces lecanii RCEF 1005]|uniref:SET domain protein n=1 Tax=Akanthomyces lecanii RCEF 1005 TaxID=1081108 RepID=A0A169YJS2_CORDF|nr:SET domain protein [Akanthomyces lecanii RCEF 1005]